MSKAIGIDLGTTNSVSAIKGVHTEVLNNAEGEKITPSCVAGKKGKWPFKKPSFIVGKHALQWLKQDPANTIYAVKRLMGRNFSDSDIQQIIKDNRLGFKIGKHSKGSENSLAIIVNDVECTPEQISSEILKKIKKDSEHVLKDTVEYAVITVPAYFNDKQKNATRIAASLAGLKTRRLLPEPTAAAISFGVDNIQGDDSKTIIVYDFGGGTFDISVLTISGGQFIEQGKGGDMWLGGNDIDDLIINYALEQTQKESDIKNITELINNQPLDKKNRFLGTLKSEVEKAKILLSSQDEAFIEVLGILADEEGDNIDVEVELSKAQFNDIISPSVDKTISLTRQLLNEINFTEDLIDNVLLVGGTSMIPLISERLKEAFGAEKIQLHDKPMLAVAEGAAMLSHRLAETYECPKCGKEVSQIDKICSQCQLNLEKHIEESGIVDIVHTAAHDYYILLENGEKHLLIEKNSPLPIEKKEVFKLVNQKQRLVHLKFSNIVNDVEESIGDLWIGLEHDAEKKFEEIKGPLHVELTLNIDENNIVEVTAALKEFPDVNVARTLSRGKADEKLFLKLEQSIHKVNELKVSHFSVDDFLCRSFSIIEDINKVVIPETEEIDDAVHDRADMLIDKAVKMAEEEYSSMPTIWYGENAIKRFGFLISPKQKALIEVKMNRLRDIDKTGTYEDNIAAFEELDDELDNMGIVNPLVKIEQAAELCYEKEPSRAPRFEKCVSEILKNMQSNNSEKVDNLLQEVMPDVIKITSEDSSLSGFIHKDITR